MKANPTTADIQKMAEDIEKNKEKKEEGGGTEKNLRKDQDY